MGGNVADLSDVSITGKIYRFHEQKEQRKSRRLGGSLIGEACDRKVWYSFRHASPVVFSGRMLRLFETGHIQEQRIIDELKAAGYTITDQQAIYTAVQGHFVDKPDGVIDGKHSLEVKTMNDKAFKKLKKDGIPDKHNIQLSLHMFLGGYTTGWYIAVNKNDEEIYAQKVALKKTVAGSALSRAERIINSLTPPPRIGGKDFWLCKFCDFRKTCHDGEQFVKNCRTCKYSTPVKDGQWRCERFESVITDTDYGANCSAYEAIDNA
jgi:hypothetical protein